MTEANLPEGWYRDPSLPGTKRWWDGQTWTDHVRPDEDAGLGLGASRSASSPGAVSASSAPVTEPTTFAMPSELVDTQPVSSVGSASVVDPAGGDRWAAHDPAWGTVPAGAAAMPTAGGAFAAPTSVAQLESVDYTPMERSWAPSAASGAMRRVPLATGTAGAWMLALSPLLSLLLLIGVGALFVTDPSSPLVAISNLASGVIMFVWIVGAVIADFRRLGALGYSSRPSVFWILLGPLPYLISRAIHVHRATDRGSATLWVYLLVSVLVGVGGALAVLSFTPELLEWAQQLG